MGLANPQPKRQPFPRGAMRIARALAHRAMELWKAVMTAADIEFVKKNTGDKFFGGTSKFVLLPPV
jgi:hypothetical protein